ncbi:type I polyketide synthase [Amycolatopsis nigrescens]|uniref:type I polyketide synthase n=1 Tax=Amycolatopsis nigrescens TaxID=381445 RepID=UPI000377E9A3|nr:type I polyketide synthase [Amycolatopsis nigrescens]
MSGYENAIAVIGFAGRFPGADSVEAFWDNLSAGRNTLSWFDETELAAAGVPPETIADPGYLPVRGVLQGIEDFDADLFGMTPREAALTDPQQRLVLECARTAMETAGYPPESCPERVGVFLGSSAGTYLGNLAAASGFEDELAVRLGNDPAFLATRVAYKLNFRGPAITVQTACSTALVAVHLAGQSLLCGEAGLALAGGVSITLPETAGQWHTTNGIISADGRCRSFDAGATGTVSGNGGGVVVLKPAEAALADGDRVYALIRGSAVNNDGAGKLGYAAPSVAGQAEVITMAHQVAGVSPDEISYVEAHATGTELGDPIEVAALTEAFRRGTDRTGYCALGSVKPNIGHLDAAAGVAGFIKAVLALHHEMIPPTIEFARPNPHIPFAGSPFFVNTERRPWPRLAGTPRRCGVSSFGIGGTNAHVVLEEEPVGVPGRRRPSDSARPVVLPLSARTPDALAELIAATSDRLSEPPRPVLPDAAYTLQTGRTEFGHRAAVVAGPEDSVAELRSRLDAAARGPGIVRNVVFLFPGQGTFRPGMLSELYAGSARVRAVVDECAASLRDDSGANLRGLLLGESGEGPSWLTQPALFVVGYALAELLKDGGIQPDALLGHSLGEYVAACVGGALSLADALTLVAQRARAMAATPPGAMLAVAAPEDRVRPYLDGPVWISGVLGPDSVVVAGSKDAVRRLAAGLLTEDIATAGVRVDKAFHTPLIAPALPALRRAAGAVAHRPLSIPVIANATGALMPVGTVLSPEHWVEQAREPVRIAGATSTALSLPNTAFLELGAGRVLTDAVRGQAGGTEPAVFPLGGRTRSGALRERDLLSALAGFWTAGGRLDWTAFSPGPGRRVPLPTYPYQRRRHWIDPGPTQPISPSDVDPMPLPDTAEPEVVDEVAAAVMEIWVELLGHNGFAPDADFLELGGNSLTAVQLLTRLRKRFGIKLSLHSLFDSSTVAGISELVRQQRAEQAGG